MIENSVITSLTKVSTTVAATEVDAAEVTISFQATSSTGLITTAEVVVEATSIIGRTIITTIGAIKTGNRSILINLKTRMLGCVRRSRISMTKILRSSSLTR